MFSAARLCPRRRPAPALRPPARDPGAGDLRIRWLGTAGVVLRTSKTTLLLDPFVSRPSPLEALARPLVPDLESIRAHVPARVDGIACGHGHYDHLLDAPMIAQLTGAVLAGSRAVCTVGRAARLPADRLVELDVSGGDWRVGDFEVRFVRSRHGLLAGRVPHPGNIVAPPRLPARWFEYRLGDPFGILVRGGGVTVYHNGSANLIDEELRGLQADVLLLTLALSDSTPRYVERLVDLLSPKVVVPIHWDSFFSPLEHAVRRLPWIDVDAFAAEVRAVAPDATIVEPDYESELVVPAADPRRAGVAVGRGVSECSARLRGSHRLSIVSGVTAAVRTAADWRVTMNYMDRIQRDPAICGGEAVMRGTRVTLRTVLASLAEGATIEAIVADFPTLTEDDVRAAIAFAAASAGEDLPTPAVPTDHARQAR